MKHNLELWKKLYELSDQLCKFKPWEHIWSNEFVCLELEKDIYTYCTVMGRNGDCIGISMYEGEEGYADLCSISHEYSDMEVSKYVMFDQSCLTWYMGDVNEVPLEQKKIMKELGIRYRGHNHWPYFISFESRYFPGSIHDSEAKKMIIVLERLIDVLKDYVGGKIDVNFNCDEMIFAHFENEQWIYESMCLPEPIDKYCPIELEDQSLYEKLYQQKRVEEKLYLDLSYFNSSVQDKEFKKPLNALLFLAMDEQTKMIIDTHFFQPTDDEIGIVLNFFVRYILAIGRPDTVYVRNPRVFSAILDICEYCNIKMEIGHFRDVDHILDELNGIK